MKQTFTFIRVRVSLPRRLYVVEQDREKVIAVDISQVPLFMAGPWADVIRSINIVQKTVRSACVKLQDWPLYYTTQPQPVLESLRNQAELVRTSYLRWLDLYTATEKDLVSLICESLPQSQRQVFAAKYRSPSAALQPVQIMTAELSSETIASELQEAISELASDILTMMASVPERERPGKTIQAISRALLKLANAVTPEDAALFRAAAEQLAQQPEPLMAAQVIASIEPQVRRFFV